MLGFFYFCLMPSVDYSKYMLPCLNKKLFGIDCPGCGAQRSLMLLLKGEFKEAFHMYPAIYTLITLGLILIVGIFNSSKQLTIFRNILIGINVCIIVISYLIKMKIINF